MGRRPNRRRSVYHEEESSSEPSSTDESEENDTEEDTSSEDEDGNGSGLGTQFNWLAEFKRKKIYFNPEAFCNVEWDGDGIPILEEFDMDMLPPDGTIVNFGKRRTGKTVCTKNILLALAHFFPRAYVFSDTNDLNHNYDDHFPEHAIYEWEDDAVLASMLELQKKIKERPDYEELEARMPDFDRFMVVFDDVIRDENLIRYSKPLRTAFVEGRHYKGCFLLNTQYHKAIPPTMRTNVDVAFLFQSMDKGVRETIFELFGQEWQDKNLFYAVLDAYTKDHSTLVFYNVDSKERDLTKRFFWYRGLPEEELPPFKMGNEEFWMEGCEDDETGLQKPGLMTSA